MVITRGAARTARAEKSFRFTKCFGALLDISTNFPSFLACRSTRGCRWTVSQTSRSARPVRTAPWRRGRRRCAPRRGSFGTCSRGLSPSCTPRPSRSPSPRRWNPRSPTPRPRPRHPTMLPSRSHPRTRSPSPRRALGRLPRRTTRSACRIRSSTRTRSAWPRSTPRYARVPARTSDGTIGQTERSKKGCPFFFLSERGEPTAVFVISPRSAGPLTVSTPRRARSDTRHPQKTKTSLRLLRGWSAWTRRKRTSTPRRRRRRRRSSARWRLPTPCTRCATG